MSNDRENREPQPDHRDTVADTVEASRRDLLKKLGKGVYVAPVALAMMTTKASACSLTC